MHIGQPDVSASVDIQANRKLNLITLDHARRVVDTFPPVATLTSNSFLVDLTDTSTKRSQGEVGGMLNFFQGGTGWSAFVKGDYRFASGYSSGSVKGGVRYPFGWVH